MKIIKTSISCIFLIVFLTLGVCAATSQASIISQQLRTQCPARFGYVDNSEYYMSSYFSELKNIDDFIIVTSADSTDFSQIGVFHMKSSEGLSANKKYLEAYLKTIKKNFESGVVYNTEEYPKFENASVIAKGNYLIYLVLDKPNIKAAEKTIAEMIS